MANPRNAGKATKKYAFSKTPQGATLRNGSEIHWFRGCTTEQECMAMLADPNITRDERVDEARNTTTYFYSITKIVEADLSATTKVKSRADVLAELD